MLRNNLKVENIIKWRESLATLPDHYFFEIIRMYLGEVKTPYSKQKLIEELSAFLRKEETKENIKLLLSQDDIQVLSAIEHIPDTTQNILADFFAKKFTFVQLHEKLLNLEERLLIFRFSNRNRLQFAINPLLYETLQPYLIVNNLFSDDAAEETAKSPETKDTPLSQVFLGSFLSFITFETELCKGDGNLKKRGAALAKSIFPQFFLQENENDADIEEGAVYLNLFIEALKNLQLITQEESTLIPDYARWNVFAELPEIEQYAYICAAACGKHTHQTILSLAQLVLLILQAIPPEGLSAKVLNRRIFLLIENNEMFKQTNYGRFAFMLERSREMENSKIDKKNLIFSDDALLSDDKKILIEKMIFFSLLRYKENTIFAATNYQIKPTEGQFLQSDGGYMINIFPEMQLRNLIPFMQFLHIRSFDIVSKFEITKQSCQKAFDYDFTPEKILSLFQTNMSNPLKQTIQFSIEDWYKNYLEVSLYKGYVLEISPEKLAIISANKLFNQYLQKKLSDTIYVLSFPNDDTAIKVCQKVGLEFITSIRTKPKEVSTIGFFSPCFPSNSGKDTVSNETDTHIVAVPLEEQQAFLENLTQTLHERKYTHEQTDILEARISRRIILTPEQLRPNSVRFEVNEASGMDFLGKIRIIEYSVTTESMVELHYDEKNEIIVGIPLSTEKKEGDVLVKIQTEPNNEALYVSIGKASFVKRIRGAIFKEASHSL